MIGLLKNLKGKDFATQTTLEAARALLETILGLDFAEETTLDALKTVVESIKSTDGIKKITDPLPAGTNEIGEVVISGDETLPSSARRSLREFQGRRTEWR